MPWTKAAVSLRQASNLEGERRDSNPRPPGPQPGALPTELRPPGFATNLARRDGESRGAVSAPGRIRTCDPRLRRPPLCPLSYGGARPLSVPCGRLGRAGEQLRKPEVTEEVPSAVALSPHDDADPTERRTRNSDLSPRCTSGLGAELPNLPPMTTTRTRTPERKRRPLEPQRRFDRRGRPDRRRERPLRRQRLLRARAGQAARQGDAWRSSRPPSSSGEALDTSLADAVAAAMKEWALERGATHYTHVFQPLTGLTAEKHDSFFEPVGDGTRDRQVLGQGADPGRAGRLLVPDGRRPRHLRGPRLHRLGPDQPRLHPREPERRAALHPDGVRLLDRRGARRQDPAAALDGRALEARRSGRCGCSATRSPSGSSPRSAPSRSTS